MPYKGNNIYNYKSINPNIENYYSCYSSEVIRNPDFKLPDSGKAYFELTLSHYNANLFEISNLNATSSVFAMIYGNYNDNYKKLYTYNGKNTNWLKNTFNSGDTLQIWIDIDAGNILINKLGDNDPSFYVNPILD